MMAGAISHIALAGGWLARKSPPYTVSSKCSHVESPSPFVLTAPLMPPCAQTECDRLTGTTESRSTWCPASAIFIAAASPASPPPTMATRMPFFVAIVLENPSQQAPRTRAHECVHHVEPEGEQHHAEGDAGVARQALRALADDDAPVDREEPDAVGEVPDGRDDADDVDADDPRNLELVRDDVESD